MPFRGILWREGVLLKGPFGWGEYSPLPGYRPGTDRRCLEAARRSATEPWPPPVRAKVPVHATVPAVSAREAASIVRESGCNAAKVKVGEGDDEERVEAVRDALGTSGRLVVDANGVWDVDTAARMLERLSGYGVDVAEQPVATLQEMATLRRRVDIPIAADESVGSPEDARRVAELEAADVLVIKVQPLGGVVEAMSVVEASGLPAIVSSMLETSVGLAAGLALAAALPELPYPCGLGSAALLDGDVVAEPLVPRGGWLELRRPEVDRPALSRFRAEVKLPSDGKARV
ncbi:MAG: o-succinylbenzoate synthase [Actinomycetota bacterium]|nr:o-succinylbenzoate synthase [Actinomycetota bacterium]